MEMSFQEYYMGVQDFEGREPEFRQTHNLRENRVHFPLTERGLKWKILEYMEVHSLYADSSDLLRLCKFLDIHQLNGRKSEYVPAGTLGPLKEPHFTARRGDVSPRSVYSVFLSSEYDTFLEMRTPNGWPRRDCFFTFEGPSPSWDYVHQYIGMIYRYGYPTILEVFFSGPANAVGNDVVQGSLKVYTNRVLSSEHIIFSCRFYKELE